MRHYAAQVGCSHACTDPLLLSPHLSLLVWCSISSKRRVVRSTHDCILSCNLHVWACEQEAVKCCCPSPLAAQPLGAQQWSQVPDTPVMIDKLVTTHVLATSVLFKKSCSSCVPPAGGLVIQVPKGVTCQRAEGCWCCALPALHQYYIMAEGLCTARTNGSSMCPGSAETGHSDSNLGDPVDNRNTGLSSAIRQRTWI